ncbi:hypothetical protein EDC04DRAFT_2757855 [Pisolithus marmoratus]|nr:hypothetical protein EDC04DRAFT_2757855 [Pisolithus marmoratus]
MQTGGALPTLHTRFDEFANEHYPNHDWGAVSPNDLKTYLQMMGAGESNFEECLYEYNHGWDELVDGGFTVVGEKPHPGDGQTPLIFHIPNSQYAIRIWSGGMEQFRQFCLDFYDLATGNPVNTPYGFELWDVPRPGAYSFGGKLFTWEETFGLSNVPPGEEKYSVPEGSRLSLKRPGEPPFYFEIPAMPVENGIPFAHAVPFHGHNIV